MNYIILLVGYAASVLSTFSFIPQALYVVRTKDTQSISLPTYTLFVLSVVLWFIYGIFLRDIPIMASNIVSVVMGGIILWYKIKEVIRTKAKEQRDTKGN